MAFDYYEVLNERLKDIGPSPEPIKLWYAYKDGQAHTFPSRASASKFSKLIEHQVLNKEVIQDWYNKRKQVKNQVYCEWEKELRADHWEVSDEMFHYLMGEAWNDTNDCNEVAAKLGELVHIAAEIIKIHQKESGNVDS